MKFRSKVRGTIEAEPVQFAGADYVLADVGLAAPVAIPADVFSALFDIEPFEPKTERLNSLRELWDDAPEEIQKRRRR